MKDLGAYREPIPVTGRPELRWIDAALFDSGFQFDAKVRQAYYDLCMEMVAPELHFNEETWIWLNEHPAVFNATFAHSYPPNPNIIHNFIKLAKLVGPTYAEKYQQLLIAFAVANKDRAILKGAGSKDRYGNISGRNLAYDPAFKATLEKGVLTHQGWYLNHDVAIPHVSTFAKDGEGRIFEDEADRLQRMKNLHAQFDLGSNNDAKQTADWLKRNQKTKVYELLAMTQQEFYGKTGIRLSGEPSKLPWDTIAHVAHRYPPRMMGPLVENLCLRIQRYEEKGAEKSGLFPLSTAPWPLLLLLTQDDPLDESTFFWNLYKGKGSVPGYATYSFDYMKPEIRYRDAEWQDSANPRILDDGGVCGRLSTMAEFAQRSIGTPAQGMGQPGHRAFMNYAFVDGKYVTQLNHSVNNIEVSTVGWHLPSPFGAVFDDVGKTNYFAQLTADNCKDGMLRNNVRWHIGLCEAMNRGLKSWEDTRMAMTVLDFYPTASMKQKEAMLRSAFILNIGNTDVTFRLAQLRDGNARQILKLMDAFRNGFVKTNEGLSEDQKIKADQDLSKLLKSNAVGPRNPKKVTNEWALFISNQIFIGAFSNIPNVDDPKYKEMWAGEKIALIRSYDKAIKDELSYQKKIPGNGKYVAIVQALNDKYDKTRLEAARDKTRNVKEERNRKKSEQDAW
ncbi:MAG: hypothetical protein RSB74_01640 [Kiritimatiellia bacterium]